MPKSTKYDRVKRAKLSTSLLPPLCIPHISCSSGSRGGTLPPPPPPPPSSGGGGPAGGPLPPPPRLFLYQSKARNNLVPLQEVQSSGESFEAILVVPVKSLDESADSTTEKLELSNEMEAVVSFLTTITIRIP